MSERENWRRREGGKICFDWSTGFLLKEKRGNRENKQIAKKYKKYGKGKK